MSEERERRIYLDMDTNNMKQRIWIVVIGVVLLFCLLFIAFSFSGQYEKNQNLYGENIKLQHQISTLQKQNNDLLKQVADWEKKNDIAHFEKTFYGQWRIGEVIATNYVYGDNDGMEELKGKIIEYTPNEVKIDGKVVATDVFYNIALVANTPTHYYQDKAPTYDQLGIHDDVIIYVLVECDEIYVEGIAFFIIDDQTMVLLTSSGRYVKLTRVFKPKNDNPFDAV